MNLSPSQIAQFAAAAGFSGNDLPTAVAIALAESSGNPQDYNKEPQDVPGRFNRSSPDDGLGSYGLWQIYLAAHPEFAGEDLTDPQTNANAAYETYAIAGGFTPWATYTSGAYQKYLPSVLAAIAPAVNAPTPLTLPPPLILDGTTGLPVTQAEIAAGAYVPPSMLPAAPSFGQVVLWGGLGLAALWILSEAW